MDGPIPRTSGFDALSLDPDATQLESIGDGCGGGSSGYC